MRMYSYKSHAPQIHRHTTAGSSGDRRAAPPAIAEVYSTRTYGISDTVLSVAAQPCSVQPPPRLPAPRPPPQYLPTTVGGNLELSLVDRLLIWPKGAARERALCPCQRSHLLWASRKCGSTRPSRTHCAWRPFPTISRTQSAPGLANSGPTFQAHVRARTRGSDCSLARSTSLSPATYEQAREQHEAKPYYLRHPIRLQGSGSG